MGIGIHALRTIIAMRQGERGGLAVSLGRPEAYLNPGELRRLEADFPEDQRLRRWIQSYKWGQPGDTLFTELLGYDRLDALDASDFEGANIVHDLNEPLPAELSGKYDLAYNGGTLEHVFNLPDALRNFMALVRPGGWIYFSGPSNNLSGHGFYQFSPELIYRVFSPQNGFEPRFIRLVESRLYHAPERTPHPRAYDVVDPASIGGRVNVLGGLPLNVVTLARRSSDILPFEITPQQSDYVASWGRQREKRAASSTRRFARAALAAAPRWLAEAFREFRHRRQSHLHTGRAFKRVDY